MKQLFGSFLLVLILGLGACNKCYTCQVAYTDESGNETFVVEEKRCVERGGEDPYKFSPNCID